MRSSTYGHHTSASTTLIWPNLSQRLGKMIPWCGAVVLECCYDAANLSQEAGEGKGQFLGRPANLGRAALWEIWSRASGPRQVTALYESDQRFWDIFDNLNLGCAELWEIWSLPLRQILSKQWKCLLADHYGLPIGDYWQTVHKICSGTSALPQSFEQCSNSCSIIQSNRGLPTRRFWHNLYKFCERSANNL